MCVTMVMGWKNKLKKAALTGAGVLAGGLVAGAAIKHFTKRQKIPYQSSGGITRYLGKRKQKRKR